MRETILGNHIRKVPSVAVGCMRLSEKSKDEMNHFIHAALEQGAYFFDHADIYGGGMSESIFGEAFADDPSLKREDMYLQSKCGIRQGFYDFSKEHILKSVDGILQRLHTDYLDLLLLHRPDALVEPEEVAAAFDVLFESGKVRNFGVSNHKPMQIELLQKYVRQPLVVNQVQFSIPVSNLVANGMEVNMETPGSIDHDGSLLDYCRLHDITLQAWSPFQMPSWKGCFLGSDEYPELNQKIRVLAEKYAVYATQGNLNNHIGVPLTLLAMTRDTELGVVEMGASACGEIALLCAIAEPNFGLITNVGRAHLEGFGGVEGVRRGKGELYDYLAANGGRAFVRRDDGTLVKMAAERGNLAVEFYDPAIADGVGHRLEGAFNRLNVAAAMAVGRYFGVDEERIRDAVAAYRPDNNRSQRRSTARNTLVVDCYNANPSSMQASLANFLGEESVGGKVAVLGDMLELGAWSAAEHRAAVEQALAGDVEQLWLVGTEFSAAWRAMGCGDERVRLFATCDEAAAALQASPFAGKFVLLKGSHGIGLERLIEWL